MRASRRSYANRTSEGVSAFGRRADVGDLGHVAGRGPGWWCHEEVPIHGCDDPALGEVRVVELGQALLQRPEPRSLRIAGSDAV